MMPIYAQLKTSAVKVAAFIFLGKNPVAMDIISLNMSFTGTWQQILFIA